MLRASSENNSLWASSNFPCLHSSASREAMAFVVMVISFVVIKNVFMKLLMFHIQSKGVRHIYHYEIISWSRFVRFHESHLSLKNSTSFKDLFLLIGRNGLASMTCHTGNLWIAPIIFVVMQPN